MGSNLGPDPEFGPPETPKWPILDPFLDQFWTGPDQILGPTSHFERQNEGFWDIGSPGSQNPGSQNGPKLVDFGGLGSDLGILYTFARARDTKSKHFNSDFAY